MTSVQLGTVIAGRYRVDAVIGQGGMGTVYAARNQQGGELALKLMLPELAANPTLRARFEQEARIGAHLASENIVKVFDAGVDAGGLPFLAMELLRGKDLAVTMRERRSLTRAEVAELVLQLGRALGAAHAQGIVHRDLKPENVFLAAPTQPGSPFTVKVLDFGIAKVIAQSGMRTTAPIGTLLWMAPEQTTLKGNLTPAADIWSIGLLAFYVLTGAFYWNAPDDPAALLREMLVAELDRPSVRAGQRGHGGLLPDGFDAWFFRCVARPPEQRYPGAGNAAEDLAKILSVSTVAAPAAFDVPPPIAPGVVVPAPARPVVASKKRGTPWAALVGGLIALGGVGLGARAMLHRSSGACDDVAAANREEACASACDGTPSACATHGALLDARRGQAKEAAAAYKKGCDKSDGASCVGLARHQRDAIGVDKDEKAAAVILERECAASTGAERPAGWQSQRACTELARLVEAGVGTKADPKRAIELYGKACTGKIGVACLGAAAMLELGEAADPARMAREATEAAKILDDECNAQRIAESCGALGRLHLVGLGVAADPAAAKALLERACDQNHLESCAVLAGTEADDKAQTTLRGACDAGGSAACGRLGNRLRMGDAKAADEARALLDKACSAGDGVGCYGMALLAAKDARRPWFDKAAAPLARACALGDPESCEALGLMRLAGDKGRDSGEEIKAAALLERACNGGRAKACTQLGWLALNRRAGAPKADRARALERYKKACDAAPSDADACARQGLVLLARYGVGVQAEVDETRAASLFHASCKQGSKLGCYLERREDPSEAEPAKREKALGSTDDLKSACGGGELDACFELARALMQVGRADTATMEATLKAPCEAGDARACGELGYALDQGAVDAGKRALDAAGYYHRACDCDVDFACIYLAGMFGRADAAARLKLAGEGFVDEKRAEEIKKTWCDGATGARKAHCAVAFSAAPKPAPAAPRGPGSAPGPKKPPAPRRR